MNRLNISKEYVDQTFVQRETFGKAYLREYGNFETKRILMRKNLFFDELRVEFVSIEFSFGIYIDGEG